MRHLEQHIKKTETGEKTKPVQVSKPDAAEIGSRR